MTPAGGWIGRTRDGERGQLLRGAAPVPVHGACAFAPSARAGAGRGDGVHRRGDGHCHSAVRAHAAQGLSLIHISEPTRPEPI
eukprot:8833060-Pyramimonas_sp.AAC.1